MTTPQPNPIDRDAAGIFSMALWLHHFGKLDTMSDDFLAAVRDASDVYTREAAKVPTELVAPKHAVLGSVAAQIVLEAVAAVLARRTPPAPETLLQ